MATRAQHGFLLKIKTAFGLDKRTLAEVWKEGFEEDTGRFQSRQLRSIAPFSFHFTDESFQRASEILHLKEFRKTKVCVAFMDLLQGYREDEPELVMVTWASGELFAMMVIPDGWDVAELPESCCLIRDKGDEERTIAIMPMRTFLVWRNGDEPVWIED